MERQRERMRPAVVEHFERVAYSHGAVVVHEVDGGEVCDGAAVVFFGKKVAAVCEGWKVDPRQLKEGKAFAYVPGNKIYGGPEEGEECLLVAVVGFDVGDYGQHQEVADLLQEITRAPVSSFSFEGQGDVRGYAAPVAFCRETPTVIFREMYAWNYLISVEIISLGNF